MSQNRRNKGFLTFLLGDGRIRLNNDRSGSVRPKNLRFPIRIRIHNTEENVLKSIGHLQSEQQNVVAALQCKLHSRLPNTVRSTEGHLLTFQPLQTLSFFTFYPPLPLVFSASFLPLYLHARGIAYRHTGNRTTGGKNVK